QLFRPPELDGKTLGRNQPEEPARKVLPKAAPGASILGKVFAKDGETGFLTAVHPARQPTLTPTKLQLGSPTPCLQQAPHKRTPRLPEPKNYPRGPMPMA